jgi:phosphate transport system protein
MHLREYYYGQLEEIQASLDRMGEQVKAALKGSLEALRGHDRALATQVIAADAQINTAQLVLNERAIALMATQQPVASDLRLLVVTLAVASELERMGDYATGNARLVLHEHERMPIDLPPQMVQLTTQATAMLDEALAIFRARDIERARRLRELDIQVDETFYALRQALFEAENNGSPTNSTLPTTSSAWPTGLPTSAS